MNNLVQALNPVNIWLSLVARMSIFAVALMWPAGSWMWWEAWDMVGLRSVFVVTMTAYLSRNDPALLKERMKLFPMQQEQKGWDKVLMSLFFISGIVLYIVPGFDVIRFGWSEPFPTWLEMLAFLLQIPCLLFIGWVMHENSFLSQVVKIDQARDHQVITTGPYAMVRHPMYSALIVLFIAFPAALGSRMGLIPAAMLTVLLIVRTHLEDHTLKAELEGYAEYARHTRYRLIPGIW